MQISKMMVLLYMMLGLSLSATNTGIIPAENIIRLVFLGKSGAGKSTLINSFYNFAKNTAWNEYPKLFPIPTDFQPCNVSEYEHRRVENHQEGQLRGVTQEPSEYTVSGRSYVLNLIDCPGAADASGVDRDHEIAKSITEFIARIGTFNAICIVLKGDLNRLSIEEEYVFAELKSILPKNAHDRIFIVVTHTTEVSTNVLKAIIKVGLPTKNIFAFDGRGLNEDGYLEYRGVSTNEDRADIEDPFAFVDVQGDSSDTQKKASKVKDAWNESKESFSKLLIKARGLGKYETDEMAHISEIKAGVTERIHETLRKIETIETTQIELRGARLNLKRAREAFDNAQGEKEMAEKRLYLVFEEGVATDAMKAYEYYAERMVEATDFHNTICVNCTSVCHLECGLEYRGEFDIDYIHSCAAMENGSCKICPNKCSYRDHRHRKHKWVTTIKQRVNEDVVRIKKEAVQTFHNAHDSFNAKNDLANIKKKESTDLQDLEERMSSQLAQLVEDKETLQNEIVELYIELEGVSMCSINFFMGEYYDKLIKMTKDTIKKNKLQMERDFYAEQIELYKLRQSEHLI